MRNMIQVKRTYLNHVSLRSLMPDDEAIVKRLDALIYLTLNVARLKDLTSEQKIQELKGLGFTDVEVAKIIGKTRGYVSSAVSRARRRKA